MSHRINADGSWTLGAATAPSQVVDHVSPTPQPKRSRAKPAKRNGRNELAQAVDRLARVKLNAGSMPILGCVLLEAKADALTMKRTDVERGASLEVQGVSEGEWAAAVDWKQFVKVAKALAKREAVTLTRDEKGDGGPVVVIASGETRFEITATSAEEFPMLPPTLELSEIDGPAFAADLEAVAYAASHDETRYNLNGVCLERESARVVATDGHRLATRDVASGLEWLPLPSEGKDETAIIVPLGFVTDFVREGAQAQSARIGAAAGLIHAELDGLTLQARLIDGEYPDYRQVIPKEHAVTVRAERDELDAALKLVSLMAPERSRAVKVTLNGEGLELATENPDLGSALETVAGEIRWHREHSEEFTVGFNARYVLEALANLGGDRLTLAFADMLSPVTIQRDGEAGTTAVVMPMRL